MIFKNIIGVYEFVATGANGLKLINLLNKSAIKAKDVYCKNSCVYGKIYATNYNELCELCSISEMDLSISKKVGLVFKFLKYKKRYGIIAGVIFATFISFLLSNTVLTIEIKGCSEPTYDLIMNYINSRGIKPGKFMPSLDLEDIEKTLMTGYDEIGWASIRSLGGKIIVDVNEATAKPEMTPTRSMANIVATNDGQVKYVEVTQGQLMVVIGDAVKKGQLLVSGVVVDGNGNSKLFHSMGKIVAQYEDEIVFTQKLNERVTTETGEVKKRNYFSFFNVDIPLFIGGKLDGNYTQSQSNSKFNFFTIKLPFGLTKKTYTEYAETDCKYTEQQAIQMVENQIDNYEKNFLADSKILDKKIGQSKKGGTIEYKVKYKIEGDIGKTTAVPIKN